MYSKLEINLINPNRRYWWKLTETIGVNTKTESQNQQQFFTRDELRITQLIYENIMPNKQMIANADNIGNHGI